MIHSFITSNIIYCNSLHASPPKKYIMKLQPIISTNFLADYFLQVNVTEYLLELCAIQILLLYINVWTTDLYKVNTSFYNTVAKQNHMHLASTLTCHKPKSHAYSEMSNSQNIVTLHPCSTLNTANMSESQVNIQVKTTAGICCFWPPFCAWLSSIPNISFFLVYKLRQATFTHILIA